MEIARIDSIVGMTPATQYALNSQIDNFYRVLKQMMYNRIVEKMDLIPQFSWQYRGDNEYMTFFYANIYNLYAGFGEAVAKTIYDDGELWDSGVKYDEKNDAGNLGLSYFKIAAKYLMSYSDECFTYSWLLAFIEEFTGLKPYEYQVRPFFGGTSKAIIYQLRIVMPRNFKTALFRNFFFYQQNFNMIPLENFHFELG